MDLLDRLICKLLVEQPQYRNTTIPDNEYEKKQLFRSLVNVRPALAIDDDFLYMQDNYLQHEIAEKGIIDICELEEIQPKLYLWRGDITRLKVDAIVNAANSGMIGCFVPCHACIDNAIHTYAGVQLRLECEKIMQEQAYPETTGGAKITSAYNLPSRYILHTVGPIIKIEPTKSQCEELAACYRSCFELADNYRLSSISYCCISTGEFRFPNQQAAEIAIQTIKACMQSAKSIDRVVFNVYKKEDYNIYADLLG